MATPALGAILTDSLSSVRQKKKVSLEDISRSTKIGLHYLRAIEEGAFEKLPGGVYDLSYIRQYARAIDYDESELIAFYIAKTGIGAEPAPAKKSLSDRLHLPGPIARGLLWLRMS